LTKSQQASVGESVAGVFQINILKAAMSDLSSQTSNYKRALDTANSATNEAYKRNEQLNQSLDALVNRTLANLTQAGASLGGGALGPAIENILGVVNTTIESFGKDGAMEASEKQ
jgi:chromosome segregation ATPase